MHYYSVDAVAYGAIPQGVVDSGQKTVFEIGIPGLDIPFVLFFFLRLAFLALISMFLLSGIFSIGPSLQVNVQAKATLDVDLNMEVDIAVSGLLFLFE